MQKTQFPYCHKNISHNLTPKSLCSPITFALNILVGSSVFSLQKASQSLTRQKIVSFFKNQIILANRKKIVKWIKKTTKPSCSQCSDSFFFWEFKWENKSKKGLETEHVFKNQAQTLNWKFVLCSFWGEWLSNFFNKMSFF